MAKNQQHQIIWGNEMREKTKIIGSWSELVEFVENINPNNETLCLTGWMNEIHEGKTYIRQLYFTTKDVTILKKKVNKDEFTKNVKKSVASKKTKNTRK